MMNMIVAVDDNWGIGYKNKMPVSIPADKKFFRDTTTGKVVVMGRKTLESFPGQRPLPNRVNIVLTGRANYEVKGAVIVHSLEELLQELSRYPAEDVYVIGGDSVYHQMLPYCGLVHVTKIHHRYEVDTWFPNLDEMPEWEITADSGEQTYFDLEYEFLRYERVKG